MGKPDIARREEAARLYKQGLSLRQVAEIMGITHQGVVYLLEAAGVERRSRGGNTGSHSRHRR